MMTVVIISKTHSPFYGCTGSYCIEGAANPTPCPVGKFGKELRAKTPNDCHSCPNNTYNDLEGQISCKPCGSSAVSAPDFQTCDCVGKNRLFLKSSGRSQSVKK